MSRDSAGLQQAPSIPYVGSVLAKCAVGGRQAQESDSALHLMEVVPVVRQRLALDAAIPDDSVLACLAVIAKCSTPRERWRAAFDSNLGHWLALTGSDLNAALNTLVAMTPCPRL